MTRDWPSLAGLAAQYGLKVPQAQEAVKKLKLRDKLWRGAARVAPWQEALLRPELERLAREKKRGYRPPSIHDVLPLPQERPIVYESTPDGSGYRDEPDYSDYGFTHSEMARQLKPIHDRMMDEGDADTA